MAYAGESHLAVAQRSDALYSVIIPLPDCIPVEHMSAWSPQALQEVGPGVESQHAGVVNASRATIRFWQVTVRGLSSTQAPSHRAAMSVVTQLVGSFLEPIDKPLEADEQTQVTIAELMIAVPDGSTLDDDHFDSGLIALFNFHRAYRTLAPTLIPELTYERLEPLAAVLRTFVTEDGVSTSADHIRLLESRGSHGNPLRETLHPTEVESLSAILNRLEARDPVIGFLGHIREAEFQLKSEGRNDESVVQSAIAAEVLFGSVLGMMLWEADVNQDAACPILSKPLVPKLKSEFSVRLGGSWNLEKGVLGGWSRDVAQVRNMHVHGGYRVSRQEALAALEAVYQLRSFVADRLFASRSKFPKTAQLVIGRAGFLSRMATPELVDRWFGLHGGDAMVWINEYVVWRDDVNKMIREAAG